MIRKLLLILIVLLASATAWANDVVGIPDVHIGNIWKYREIDDFTKETTLEYSHRVVRLDDKEIVVQLQNKGTSARKLKYFTREWNDTDSGDVKWEPFNPQYKFPMSVGLFWDREFRWFTRQGASFSSFAKARVVALEKVTVPAGTFDAYKIVSNIETRKNGADAEVRTGRIITWYAPIVKKCVRVESTTFSDGRQRESHIDELVEYSLTKEPAAPGN
ncbi:MAG: hypothetical protein ABSC19_09740 [Syntrophorhabdales bacterium]